MELPFLSKRELARAWQIAKVIGRYGLAPLAETSGVGRLFRIRLWRRMERRLEDIPPPVRLRLALIELGTTFIKLGQVLSARSDLLPTDYLDELTKLQDEVPALPFTEIEPVFRNSFGISPFEAFKAFDPIPFASASIGQVYHAELKDGRRAVVKIQRPGASAQVATDLSLMKRVARIINRNKTVARFDLPSLVREFQAIISDELVYTLEAHNAETMAKEMADRPEILFPKVFWPYTSREVLTLELIEGMKITHVEELDEKCIDRPRLAVSLADSLLEQILLHGMFHGDPHPGNLIVTYEGRIAYIDTGMVGRLDRHTRELLIELAVSIFDQDIDAILSHLQQLGFVEEISGLQSLRHDLSRLITKYYFLPRKELRLGELLQRINNLLFEHDVRMQYEFGLLAKALFQVEGVAQVLDPDFDYNVAARPVIEEVRRKYYSAETFVQDAKRELRGLRRQIVDLPRRLNTVLSHLERGVWRVRVSEDRVEMEENAKNMRGNRLSFAILSIGLLLASAIILSTKQTGWLHFAAIGGIVIDVVFIPALIYAIYRSGRI